MLIDLSPGVLTNLREFLSRTTLKGSEVPAYVEIIAALNKPITPATVTVESTECNKDEIGGGQGVEQSSKGVARCVRVQRGGECGHHKYVTEAHNKLEERVLEIEKILPGAITSINNLCNKIDTLVDLGARMLQAQETRISKLEESEVETKTKVVTHDKEIGEMQSWVKWLLRGSIVGLIGVIIWFLQNYQIVATVVKQKGGS